MKYVRLFQWNNINFKRNGTKESEEKPRKYCNYNILPGIYLNLGLIEKETTL